MLYFIVNPSSSSGRGIRVWHKTEKILKGKNMAYKVHKLSGPGDAKRVAARISALETPCTCVLVGGDGTINEFLSGLTRRDHIRFCVMPTGSGNDFVRGMKLPSDPERCISMLSTDDEGLPIDTGMLTDGEKNAVFAVSSGIGYDAAACYAAQNDPLKPGLNRIRLGKLVYLVCALKMIFAIRRFRISITLDDASEPIIFPKTYFAAVMNTPYQGGGIPFSPEADPCDGMLDLITAEGLNRLQVLATLVKAVRGQHIGSKGIHLYHCRKAQIECDSEQCVHMDGEHFGFCKKITWSLSDEKLRVIENR